jgi:hypothetical protein
VLSGGVDGRLRAVFIAGPTLVAPISKNTWPYRRKGLPNFRAFFLTIWLIYDVLVAGRFMGLELLVVSTYLIRREVREF